jgi:uncharacterized membrane protein
MVRFAFRLGGSVTEMFVRTAFRLVQILGALAVATALIVGMMAVLASTRREDATTLVWRDHVTAVQHGVEVPADQASDASQTPVIVLVLAGMVLLAVLPPVPRIHVHHRSYQRSDWI